MSREVNGDRRSAFGDRLARRSAEREGGGPDRVLEEVDRELRAELSIAPSPEFEARVRQRIDERPARRWTWMPSYAWLSAAAAVVIVAGAVALLNRGPVPPPQPDTPEAAPIVYPPSPVREMAAAAPEAPSIESRRAPHRRYPARPVRAAVAPGEPEVIVPPQQADAVRRLAHVRIDVPAEPVQTLAGVPELLEVQPLVVEPIPVPGTESSSGGINPGDRGR